MNLQAWSSQFETKIFTHIKKEAAAGGRRGVQKSQRRVFCLMLCGGGNCKIVKRHFPAICMAIQPESSCERRVCSQPSHSPGQKTLACGPDECVCLCLLDVCMFCVCCVCTDQALIELCLPPNWSYKRSGNKAIRANQLQHASQTSMPTLVLSLPLSLSRSNQCSCIQSGHVGLQLKEGSWLWMLWSMTSHKGLNRQAAHSNN